MPGNVLIRTLVLKPLLDHVRVARGDVDLVHGVAPGAPALELGPVARVWVAVDQPSGCVAHFVDKSAAQALLRGENHFGELNGGSSLASHKLVEAATSRGGEAVAPRNVQVVRKLIAKDVSIELLVQQGNHSLQA